MALWALIDEYEQVEKEDQAYKGHLQKLIHNQKWNSHVFKRLKTTDFHNYEWEKEFDQEFPVFVCDKAVLCGVTTQRITLATPYTNSVPVRHYLVRRVFPFSKNHPAEYYLVPEKCYCDGHWIQLVLPMPMVITRYVETLHDHNDSIVFVSTSEDIKLQQSGKQYQLKAFMGLMHEDVDENEGFQMAVHAAKEAFPGVADEYLKCYGATIKSVEDGPATEAAQINAQQKVGFSVSFFDELETKVSHIELSHQEVKVESVLAAHWYRAIDGCQLP